MTENKKFSLNTICVQGGWQPKNGGPRQLPIYQSTTFKYDSSEQMARLFDLQENGYFYTRLSNPTNDAVAAKICQLEGGHAAILTSSGQAANLFAILNLCEAGDHFVCSNAIYGGTYNLFAVTLKKLGIELTFVPINATEEEISQAIRPNTKLVFAETVTNPTVEILDIEVFARAAHSNGIPLVVDNTFPTPINCRPIEWGADIVVHSTTKYLDGHAATVGGCVVDSGRFDWEAHADKFPGLTEPDPSYHGLAYTKAFGKDGIETLHLRVQRHCENAQKVAEYLEQQPQVAWVNYAGLPSSKDYDLAKKYMPNGICGVVTFGLKGDRNDAIKFMDKLNLISIVTHVADSQSCILHPASHTHRQMDDEQLKEAGIRPDLMRLSVGIEDSNDILEDIANALK